MPATEDLLRAIAAGRIHRAGKGINAPHYDEDGTPVNGMLLRRLHRNELIHLPMRGDPTLTDDGRRLLQDQQR